MISIQRKLIFDKAKSIVGICTDAYFNLGFQIGFKIEIGALKRGQSWSKIVHVPKTKQSVKHGS